MTYNDTIKKKQFEQLSRSYCPPDVQVPAASQTTADSRRPVAGRRQTQLFRQQRVLSVQAYKLLSEGQE